MRRVAGADHWELLHPRCALDRAADIEEVEQMLSGGEPEIAIEELRWLLSGCSDFIQAHRMLGQIAWARGDVALARGHFGHGFRVGAGALKKAGMPRPLPRTASANGDFFQCGRGLIECLNKLGKHQMADEIVDQLRYCDPGFDQGAADEGAEPPGDQSPES